MQDFLDGTGTLYSMATFLNAEHPGFIDENNNFEGQTGALCSDAIGTMLGAIFGASVK